LTEYIYERAVEIASYIVEEKQTVRNAAEHFGVSKSTVHKDITQKLPETDKALYRKVRRVLDVNKAERHLRGGQATKEKYSEIKKR
jgi:putative DeoR family transcriptional regulator (stage III sporulation protein D)